METRPIAISAGVDGIDWVVLADVFERAPLGTRDPAMLEATFRASAVSSFAFDGAVLIGAGRAISDGISYALVLDLVVLPEYQGRGVGKALMSDLAARSGARSMILHSVPGKERFYAGLGYRRMKTAMGLFADEARWVEQGYLE